MTERDSTYLKPAGPPKAAANPVLGIALRLAAMAALGMMFALVKLAGQHDIHLVETLFWRQLAGLPAVLLWLWWVGKLGEIRTSKPLSHAVRGILGLISMSLNFTAMMMLPMAEATTISFASPIFATMLAAVILREPTGRYRWGAIVLGFAGVVLAMWPGGKMVYGAGVWVAIAGALLTSCVMIQIRRMSQEENTGAIVFWFSLSTLVPLGIAMPFFATSHDAVGWSIIIGLAVCGAIAQLLLTAAMRHASVAAITTMDYSGLLWSILLGYVVFNALPGPGTWFGAPVIIAAGLIILWREHRLSKNTVSTALPA